MQKTPTKISVTMILWECCNVFLFGTGYQTFQLVLSNFIWLQTHIFCYNNSRTLGTTFKEIQQQQDPTLKLYFILVWKPFYHKRKRLIMLKKENKNIKLKLHVKLLACQRQSVGVICDCECVLVYLVCLFVCLFVCVCICV